MTVAVIDIGTNTTLLLVTSIGSSGGLRPLAYEQRIPRLGRGVDASRLLLPESMERTLSVLQEYRTLLDAHSPQAVVVCGTSALRDARNSREFAARVRQVTGFTLEILTGEEEALWTYRGALSGLGGTDSAIVVDIGGGSTEVTWGQKGRFLGKASVDIGAIRLSERFFRHDPPIAEEVRQARAWVQAELAGNLRGISAIGPLIAVAGTATSLALLDQGASEFSLELVINHRLSLQSVEGLLERLLKLPHRTILSLCRALDGREDIIAGGTLILEELMRLLGAPEVLVSERGVRYGLALREWERHTGRDRPLN
jgi:exopolyphosphatase/guanosine-5'-triphosphate,3'-diphosphate pyrophosphatase